MPGHTTLWSPERYEMALCSTAEILKREGLNMLANELVGAARMIHKLHEYAKDTMKKEHTNVLIMPDDKNTGERMMKWLSFKHLPPELQPMVQLYCELGYSICSTIPAGPERTVALRKLVESKDCAVRAIIEGKEPKDGA